MTKDEVLAYFGSKLANAEAHGAATQVVSVEAIRDALRYLFDNDGSDE